MLDTELFGLAVLIGKFILNLSNILFGKINNQKTIKFKNEEKPKKETKIEFPKKHK